MTSDGDLNKITKRASNGLGLSSLQLGPAYRTGHCDPVTDFYKPCIQRAIEYDRAVGYFRSTIYLIVGTALVEYARKGGKIRLVCSPALFEEDAASIEWAYEEREARISEAISREIDQMLASPNGAYPTKVLATLILVGSLDIRLALRFPDQGLYHEKIGIFRDEWGNAVSFIGSANETWNAWHESGNFESVEVFCSWSDDREQERVRRHEIYFEQLWRGETAGVRVLPFPEAAKARLLQTAHPSLAEIDIGLLDHTLQGRSPLPHQISAIEAWELRGRRGVLEHATGSGKTFTALTAMKKHINAGLPALILVPSRLLLEQWAKEVRDEIPEAILLLAGAGNDTWKQKTRLRSMSADGPGLGPRIVLATMKTAASQVFRSKISQGDHLMVIADEVHQIGSSFNSKSLEIASGPRLGLSATPQRYGDAEGTDKIFKYFGQVVPPTVTLLDAIKAGRLVDYEYHPHPIHLTAEEGQEWRELSARIRLEIARSQVDDTGNKIVSERAKMMIIQRSRIAKKAVNKISLAVNTLSAFHEGQRWLVYCEDTEQLREVINALDAQGLTAVEYHTSMRGDREATLNWFKSLGGILVSIKCLDEGVDIPAVDHALILASSQNPRQFIQRRGRVLRKAQNKSIAVIHDAIVVPLSLEEEPEQFALLKSELLRAVQFADSALNRSAGAELRGIAARLGLDPDTLSDEGIEEEDE